MPITWHESIGHERIKEALSRAYDKNALGHAYLFSGPAGSGKFPLALDLARTILGGVSSSPDDVDRQVLAHAHPDFRFLYPVAFGKNHKVKSQASRLSDEGWEYLSSKVVEKLNNPYHITDNYSAAPMVDWIREVTSAINRGSSHEGGYTVVIIEGIDRFRKESANALLKTLEEPPARTIIILLTRSLHGVLPTIKSRCQLFRFGESSDAEITPFLQSRNPQATDEDIQLALRESFGSPGVALQKLQKKDAFVQQVLQQYLSVLAQYEQPLEQALALEKFIQSDLEESFTTAEALFEALQSYLRTGFLAKFHDEAEYILPAEQLSLFGNCSSEELDCVTKIIGDALTSIRLHTPLLLVLGTSTLKIVEILHD